MATPSNHQLERHIRQSAADSANVAFVAHAWSRMEHFVAGMNVAVVVAVQYPAPGLTVVTVIDVTKE